MLQLASYYILGKFYILPKIVPKMLDCVVYNCSCLVASYWFLLLPTSHREFRKKLALHVHHH